MIEPSNSSPSGRSVGISSASSSSWWKPGIAPPVLTQATSFWLRLATSVAIPA
jgi:hypothetical protein